MRLLYATLTTLALGTVPALAQPTGSGAPARPANPSTPSSSVSGPIAAAKTTLTWYGHAAFKIETPRGRTVLIDPWLTNPLNAAGKDLVKTTKADLVLVTHGHGDHVGDAVAIARRTKARLVATYDLGNAIVGSLGFPKAQWGVETGGNFGGTIEALEGEVAITFVPAVHSSHVGEGAKMAAGGNPGGFVIAIKNGPTLYHTGDTDVFSDMALIGRMAKIDLMLACIGGHFTMDPDRAAEATRLVQPRQIAPMHYGTFPPLKGTPAAFGAALKKAGATAKLVELTIGQPLTL